MQIAGGLVNHVLNARDSAKQEGQLVCHLHQWFIKQTCRLEFWRFTCVIKGKLNQYTASSGKY